ncbi:MAG: hypothetical protein JST37_14500 [Bacteroidetes bacterium]|jgi:hypothetical protein|nr:hypothetical protein [Bacteroidota bacterium]
MGQIFYNQLRNNRIKSIALGTLLLLMNALMLYIISIRANNGRPTNTFYALLFTAIIVGFVFLIGLIPFGQVIESLDKSKFLTFYKLGRLKFKQEIWNKVDKVTLEQDQNRNYCLTITMSSGQILVIEKHPTLDVAKVRLDEFKRLFD